MRIQYRHIDRTAAWRRLGRRLLPTLLLLASMILVGVASAMAESRAPLEYRVKAAFLYNFTRFIQWPDTSKIETDEIRLCVLGDDPFGAALDSIAGKISGNKVLIIRRYKELTAAQVCEVLFVSHSEHIRAAEILQQFKGQPMLTVSDLEHFIDDGGIIRFTTVNNKVRFEINLDAAERAGLSISSKLLNLANTVHKGDR